MTLAEEQEQRFQIDKHEAEEARRTGTTLTTGLLRRAFPKDDKGRGRCAWCGEARQLYHALCRREWLALPADSKRLYLALDIEDKARWIIDHAPAGAPAPDPS